MSVQHTNQSSNILEILEKILDKGVVIAGDIKISLADVDLLTIKIRLLIASVDKAREVGLNWWENDPYFSSRAKHLEQENLRLNERVARLEQLVAHPEEKPALLPDTHESEKRVLLDSFNAPAIIETEKHQGPPHTWGKKAKKLKLAPKENKPPLD